MVHFYVISSLSLVENHKKMQIDRNLKLPTCPAFSKSFQPLLARFKNSIWDIEDLVKQGEKKECCPYYLSRELAKNAEVIFCPYNYLIDPDIVKSLDLSLSNAIVIIDEAHNIEDSCRSAAGLDIDSQKIEDVSNEFLGLFRNVSGKEDSSLGIACQTAHVNLKKFIEHLYRWMMKPDHKFNDFNSQRKILALGKENEILDLLLELDLSSSNLSHLRCSLAEIESYISEQQQQQHSQRSLPMRHLSSGSRNILDSIFSRAQMLYDGHLSDFRVLLSKEINPNSLFFI